MNSEGHAVAGGTNVQPFVRASCNFSRPGKERATSSRWTCSMQFSTNSVPTTIRAQEEVFDMPDQLVARQAVVGLTTLLLTYSLGDEDTTLNKI